MTNTNSAMLLFPTVMLLVIIVFVYLNNRDIKRLTLSATNVNQYILKGEANDNYMFKSNTGIVNYLKARDSMKQELELLKQTVKNNNMHDIEQDKRLERSEQTDKSHNLQIEAILENNRSDLNYLVNLSFTEVNKHMPNKSDEENLKNLREIIFSYVLICLKDFDKLLPDYKLDTFIGSYGTDLSIIIAQSIYVYKIYNNFDEFPSILLMKDKLIKGLKSPVYLDFIMKTYFPRMFSYIDSNANDKLFPKLERLQKQPGKGYLFTLSEDDPFKTYIMKDITLDLKAIDSQLLAFMFVTLPTYYTRALYYNSDSSSYMKELEENIILITLDNCYALSIFYTTWKKYNPVKKVDSNLVPDTEKSKTLKRLIDGNSIFKKIYQDKIVKYNNVRRSFSKDSNCKGLPILPEYFKQFYNTDEIKM